MTSLTRLIVRAQTAAAASNRSLRRLRALVLLVALPAAAQTTYYWNPDSAVHIFYPSGGTGTWGPSNQTVAGWLFLYLPTTWNNNSVTGNNLVFGTTGGTVTLADNTTIYAHQLELTVDGYLLESGKGTSNLTLVGDTPGIVVANGVSATSSARINGSSLQLSGGGTLRLTGNNRISNATALSIIDGSTLTFDGNNESVASVLLTDGTIAGTGTLSASSFVVEAGTILAELSGAGGLLKQGSGTVTLSAGADYRGGTTMTNGTFRLGANNVLPNSGALVVAGGTLDLGAYSDQVGAVTLSGDATITGTSGSALSGSSYSVESGTVSTGLVGSAALTKSTGGVVTLSGANTYTGATTIEAGALRLLGSLGNTATTIRSGGTLTGTGSTAGTVVVNGWLSPGDDGIGTLTTGDQVWAAGGALNLELAALPDAGTGWDFLNINGSLTVSATAATPFTIELSSLGSSGANGAIEGFSADSTYAWTFVSANSIPGFADSAIMIDAGEFGALNGATGTFSLTNSGTSLTLLYTPVPEPASVALIAGGGALGFTFWRRRRAGRRA